MACYQLSESEFSRLLAAYKEDQEVELRCTTEQTLSGGSFSAVQEMRSIKLWTMAAELVLWRGDKVHAGFSPKIWLTPSTPTALTRWQLTTLRDEVPHG